MCRRTASGRYRDLAASSRRPLGSPLVPYAKGADVGHSPERRQGSVRRLDTLRTHESPTGPVCPYDRSRAPSRSRAGRPRRFSRHPATHLLPDCRPPYAPPRREQVDQPKPPPRLGLRAVERRRPTPGQGTRVRVVDVHRDTERRHVHLDHERYAIAVRTHRVAHELGEDKLRGVDGVRFDALRQQLGACQLPYGAQVSRRGTEVCGETLGAGTEVEARDGLCSGHGGVAERGVRGEGCGGVHSASLRQRACQTQQLQSAHTDLTSA